MGHQKVRRRRAWRCVRGCFGRDGSAAAEFALVAPVIISIVAGISDFGMLATKSAALAATTRIGAEYARSHTADMGGIQNSMQSAMRSIARTHLSGEFSSKLRMR